MRIAIAGGPCSGKTTMINYLKSCSFLKDYYFIDEVATQLLSNPDSVKPNCKKTRLEFQKEIYEKQIQRENIQESMFIVDRTLAEGAVYCEDIFEFGSEVGTYFSNYDLIIYLSHVDESTYEKQSQTYRSESYSEAITLAEKTRSLLHLIYKDRVIEIHRDSMEEKIEIVSELIRKITHIYNAPKYPYSQAIFMEMK